MVFELFLEFWWCDRGLTPVLVRYDTPKIIMYRKRFFLYHIAKKYRSNFLKNRQNITKNIAVQNKRVLSIFCYLNVIFCIRAPSISGATASVYVSNKKNSKSKQSSIDFST